MTLEKLEILSTTGVDVTVKINKKISLVILKFQGVTYKGTSASLASATEKALKAFQGHEKKLELTRKELKRIKREEKEDEDEGENERKETTFFEEADFEGLPDVDEGVERFLSKEKSGSLKKKLDLSEHITRFHCDDDDPKILIRTISTEQGEQVSKGTFENGKFKTLE